MAVSRKTTIHINRSRYGCYPSTGRGTINTGTTLNCNFGSAPARPDLAETIVVSNFSANSDLLLQLNYSTLDYIVVRGNSSWTFNKEKITRVFITNSSGSAIEFQLVVLGG